VERDKEEEDDDDEDRVTDATEEHVDEGGNGLAFLFLMSLNVL